MDPFCDDNPDEHGTVIGAARLGDKAAIGNGLWTTAHGGAVSFSGLLSVNTVTESSAVGPACLMSLDCSSPSDAVPSQAVRIGSIPILSHTFHLVFLYSSWKFPFQLD